MFGISGGELLIVAAVAIVIIGPKDIPKVMYGLGRVARRVQYVRYAFTQQFDDFLKAHDLDELRRGVNFEAAETDEAGADADENLPADDSGARRDDGVKS